MRWGPMCNLLPYINKWLNNSCFIQLVCPGAAEKNKNKRNKMRFLVITLILLIQACGPIWAQTQTPEPEPDSPGILERLVDRARAAQENVQNAMDLVKGIAAVYYDEHVQPVVDNYSQWAAGIRTSAREKILNYLPFVSSNTTDKAWKK
ncbi:apolipoprotein C-IV [Phyllopteryx taeniolatus]|uniref:apolipoprotein C-IV n=1 Tax=Phyllopteryx taeniolatus TaxID=161469 RepID=UPI002AD2699A|nr:apolipoprotein C-IV [Phyllopteryx taeniolatus]